MRALWRGGSKPALFPSPLTVREALECFFADRKRGSFDRVHTIDID